MRNIIKNTAIILITTCLLCSNFAPIIVQAENYESEEVYDYSNPIYKTGTEDTYLYETTDSIITTKTGLERNIPETFGKYDRSVYPIPGVQNCTEENFPLIIEENQEIMQDLETKIANGTLKKHISADGQYYGTVPNDATAVEKIAYINTNLEWTHSLRSIYTSRRSSNNNNTRRIPFILYK